VVEQQEATLIELQRELDEKRARSAEAEEQVADTYADVC
jgi:hypothetical protein